MNFSVLSARFYLVLFLLVAGARVSNAAVEPGFSRIAGSAMVNSATVSCTDNKYPYIVSTPTWTNLFTDERGVGRVTLGFDPNSLVYVSTAYTAKVTVQISYYTDAAPTTPVNLIGTQTLTVTYDPLTSSLVNQTDRHVFELNSTNTSGNIIRVDAAIVSITDASNTPMAAPANLFLEAATEVERYYAIDLATVPSPSDLSVTGPSAVNELDLYWAYIPGAEEYDVEWTYVNDYDAAGAQLGSTPANALVLDFAHNSTRITTVNNHFEIPLLFDAGYVAVRIRPVGYAYDATSSSWKKVAGRWTSDNTTSITTLGAFNTATGGGHVEHIFISDAHRLEMNWQYNASFAEQGKKKEVVSYYDGSLRNRQTVTKTSTDKKVLVGETVYDFNGRGAVSILPSPVAGTNLPIDYQLSFNRNASSVAYSRWDFDEDNGGACAVITPPMSASYGTSNYYSSSNPEQADAQQFLPDAGGYPFAQVEYTPDNTGRVRRQGGVGSTFQLNSGHETFYYYAQPFQEELDRLFGSEVGYKKHYNKTITFDGNGQASVTYVDQEGRTIATALAGDTTSKPLLALREGGDGTTSYSHNQLTLTVDLLGKDHPADVDDDQDDNLLSFNGEELTFSTQLPVTATGAYTFDYTLTGDKFSDSCLPSGICYTCVYDLEIDILDQCGQRPAYSSGDTLPISQTVGTISTDCSDPSVNFSLTPGPIVVTLNPGAYTVVKRLKINQAALDSALADFIAQSACVTPLQTMIDVAVDSVDTSGCNAACPECEDEYKSPCDASYQMMLSDVSPYGQYSEYKDSYGNVNPGAFPISVLNTNNVLPKFEADWAHPWHEINGNYDYYEPDGTTVSYIQLTGTSPNYLPAVDNISNVVMVGTTAYIKPKNLLNVDDFVFYWKDSWALSLVKYHPEYCYYEWCKGNGISQASMTPSSDNYDSLLLITSTRAAAVSAGLLDPLADAVTGASNQAGCNDPYFKTSGLGSSDYAGMHARIHDYDPTISGGAISIWKLAKIMTTCGNYYNSTQTAINTCLGTTYTDQTQYITGDQEWLNFKMLYFSLKQQYQQDRNDAEAMACDGYNGCIGNQQFNPMAAGMISNPFSGSEFLDNTNSSLSSVNTNARQPCCDLTYWLYATKVKRFVNAMDAAALATNASVTAYNQYAVSGQCPDALALQTFLNELAATDQLKASSLSLQTMNEFTPALYNSVITSPTASTVVSYTGTGTTATLTMAFNGTNVDCTSPSSATLVFGPSSSFSWANYITSFEIESFSNLITDNSNGFTVTVAIDDDLNSATPPVYEVMTGSEGCFTLTCSPPEVCAPNVTAADALTLLNLLANTTSDLASTTGVNLSGTSSPYAGFFNASSLGSHIPCGSDYYWNTWQILCNNSATNVYTLSFILAGSYSGTINSFSNPVPNSSDNTTLDLTVNTTTGSYPVTLRIKRDSSDSDPSYLVMGDCGDPVPQQCQGADFQRRIDLEALLTARITSPYTIPTSATLSTDPVFTQLLQPYGSGTYTWDAISSPSNSQWIEISDGTQLCTLKLAFANTPTGGHTFSNIVSFGQLVADETTMVNGQAFNFTITAFYSSGSELINGTSCYAIRNCPVCTIASTSTYENFDLATASAGTGLTLSTSCPVATGNYSLTNNESVRCSDTTLTGGDHNNQATGNYMFANIASSTTATLWSKTITPAAYTPYTFTAWFMDATVADNSPTSLATMELWIDGVQVKTATVVESPGVWQSITTQWNGANSTASFTIAVKVTTNSVSSWQLALDDISFYTPGCDPVSNPPLSPTYPYVNPCASNLINIATLNATQQYEQYIDSLSAQFTADYIHHCMSTAVETFDLEFAETEYQYTLYYYDQAGNLVRTVPPQGVVPADLTAIDIVTGLTIGQNIKDDRTARLTNPSAAKTFYTDHGFATNYKYNSLNQLTKQSTPDGGVTYFWYDRLGRIIASQNAKQAAHPTTQAWSYTVYDALGRISEVGELYTNTDLKGMSSVTLNTTLNDPTYPDNWANAASTTARADVTKTYYDAAQGSFGVAAYFSAGAQENLRKRVATAAVYDTYNGTTTAYTSASHYTYDIHGNVQELIQEIPQLGHMDDATAGNYQRYKQIRYVYDLVSGNVNKVMYQHEQSDRFYHKYEYDADNRVTAAYTSYDDRTWDRDAKYFYYKHGPLSRTEIGDAKVQGMDYAYTLQGWIKAVNSNSLNVTHDMGQDGNSSVNAYSSPDEMGYSLSYFDGDYAGITSNPAIASISGSGLDAASPDLYNGNIRHMITSIRQFMSGSNTPHAMAYQYDQLNRIRSSEMYSNINLGTNSWNSGGSGNAEYKEVFTYDHNGNIIRQVRNGLTPTAMDDLHYYYYTTAVTPTTYDPQSGTPTDATNKLAYVTDAVSSGNYGDDIDNQSANNYSYDEIGQLKSDAQEEIATIAWTVYGKIRSITRSGSSTKADLEFEYDAMGNRMLKITKPRTGGSPSTQDEWTYTYYVRDASGNVMSTYERTFTAPATTYDDILTLKEQNLYGSSRIGVRSPDLQLVSKNYTFSSYSGQLLVGTPVTQTTTATPLTSFEHVTGQKAYELSNHLGNVLAVVSDARQPVNGTGSMSGVVVSYSAVVVSATDYSAFGAPMAGRSYSSSSYKYGFNGKLKDDEMHGNSGDSYDFGNRIYDARLGRWLSCDPLQMKYPNLSPYIFSLNSPLMCSDPDGRDPIVVVNKYSVTEYKNEQGQRVRVVTIDATITVNVALVNLSTNPNIPNNMSTIANSAQSQINGAIGGPYSINAGFCPITFDGGVIGNPADITIVQGTVNVNAKVTPVANMSQVGTYDNVMMLVDDIPAGDKLNPSGLTDQVNGRISAVEAGLFDESMADVAHRGDVNYASRYVGRVIAHEVGHQLGLEDKYTDSQSWCHHLMGKACLNEPKQIVDKDERGTMMLSLLRLQNGKCSQGTKTFSEGQKSTVQQAREFLKDNSIKYNETKFK